MAKRFGIIGFPLEHSFSPAYFNNKFRKYHIDAQYELFPLIDIGQFPAFLKSNPELRGLSVTIPHKQSVMKFLDEIDNEAYEVGAVNCIAIRNGFTKGYNTDIVGFEQSLSKLLQPQHSNAIIFGTGGASKAVSYVLKKLGIGVTFVSRQTSKNVGFNVLSYSELNNEIIQSHLLLVNTTPLGMYPDVSSIPVFPYTALGEQHLLYDLVYNPTETRFLKMGIEKGAIVKNGMEMLLLQAEAAWEIWNN